MTCDAAPITDKMCVQVASNGLWGTVSKAFLGGFPRPEFPLGSGRGGGAWVLQNWQVSQWEPRMWRDGGELVSNLSLHHRSGPPFLAGGTALVLAGCGTVR